MFDMYWIRLERQTDIKALDIFSIQIAITRREFRTVVSTVKQCIQFRYQTDFYGFFPLRLSIYILMTFSLKLIALTLELLSLG